MRKILRISLMLFAFVITSIALFAQQPDSATVSGINGALTSLANIPALAKVFGALFFISEILGMIPAQYVPANGIFHSIYLLIKAIKIPGKAPVIILIIAGSLFGSTVKAQSAFGTLISQLPDSVKSWKGARIVGPAAVTAYSPYAKTFSALTGAGYAYTWQTLTNDSSGWYINEAVGFMLYGGGAQVPNNIAGVVAAGPYFSLLNGYISGGVAYAFTKLTPATPTVISPKFGQKLLYTFGIVLPLFP